jgi:hypothetical protein
MGKPSSSVRNLTFLPPQIQVALLVIMAFTAFLLTGFANFKNSQPLPIYIFFSILLLLFQVLISTDRSIRHLIYVFSFSIFALFYAANVIFYQGSLAGFTKDQKLYIVIQILLFIIFVYDAVDRRREESRPLDSISSGVHSNPLNQPDAPFSFNQLAIDFSGLTVLFLSNWGLLSFLGNCNYVPPNFPPPSSLTTVQQIAQQGQFPIVCGQGGYVSWPSFPLPISLALPQVFPTLDFLLGIVFFIITGLLLLIIGFTPSQKPSPAPSSTTPESASGHPHESTPQRIIHDLLAVANEGGSQVLLSLRLTLSPLVWMIPAFAFAFFTSNFSNYLQTNKGVGCHPLDQRAVCIGSLFNPVNFSTYSSDYLNALVEIVLGAVAVGGVIAAVAVVEHNRISINKALDTLGDVGVATAILLFGFLLILSAVNVIIIGITKSQPPTPFRLGPSILLALVAAIGFVLNAKFRRSKQPPEPTHTGQEAAVTEKTRGNRASDHLA